MKGKGFFIVLALLVGTVVAFLSYYQEIAQWGMGKVIEDEGGAYPNQSFDKMKAELPEEFKSRFSTDLKVRIWIANFADWTDKEELFLKVADETKTMYVDSPLAQKEGLADLIFKLAEHDMEAQHYQDAYTLFKLFMDTYPNHPDVPNALRDSEHLRLKYSLG